MDTDLIHLIRERYPFPIAHALKRALALRDDDTQKLKSLIDAAEAVIRFLALVVLAQLYRDLEHQQAPPLGSRGGQLAEDLRNPSFGKWQGILRDILKCYSAHRHLLMMPELFDFYFKPPRGQRLQVQPVVGQAIDPLIALRNQYHHQPDLLGTPSISKVEAGMRWLEQVLAGLQFLSTYQLAFIQEIKVRHRARGVRIYSHELVQMNGCSTPFDQGRWESDLDLQEQRLILLASGVQHHSLFLDPFLTVASQIPERGIFDVFALNGIEQRRARYLPTQYGPELTTNQAAWARGAAHLETLEQFFDLLRRAPAADEEVELDWDGQAPPDLAEVHSAPSIEEVSAVQSRREAAVEPPRSPYKFLDYFEPEDADLFFGREQECRELHRKFHASRLLILHGESGTGKTSLIRAGLIPQLPVDGYVPVYVRALQEPTQAIKDTMIRELGMERRHSDAPLVSFLGAATARFSKTVVLILDQFEEFFLRFPLEVRQTFHQELGACLAARLDVRVIIALRDDYFGLLAEFQEAIPDIFTHQMHLSRLTRTQALAAAVEPVKRVGLTIDETLLAEAILPQLDEPGQGIAPPLLQIVCDALYQHAQDAGRTHIGQEDYAAIGDVRQALGRYLDTTLRRFGREQPQARAVLKALVTDEGTKRASFIEEIASRLQTMGLDLAAETIERHFLHQLVQARLVRAEEVEGRTRYELTHEFLVQKIGEWIADNERELTKLLELIDRAYEAYRTTTLLLQPEALQLIAPFEEQLVLPAEKRTFLERSREMASRKRRGLWLKVGALVCVVALGVGGVFTWQLYQKAWQLDQKAQEAERNFQHALNATNTMVVELARGLEPVMGTQSKTIERILDRAEDVIERLLVDISENPQVLTGKMGMLLTYSDVSRHLGNTEQALSRAQQALEIAEKLLAFDSTNTERQAGLAASHERVGAVLKTQGKLKGALEAYQVAHTIFKQLAQQAPTATQWQSSLSRSYEQIGDVLHIQGKLEEALEAYQAALAIAKQLVQQDPTNTLWQSHLASTYDDIGDILKAQRKLEEALEAYQAALAIAKQLVQQDPTNTLWQGNVAISHMWIGDILIAQGNAAAALESYRAGVAIAKQLAQQDPTDTRWQGYAAAAVRVYRNAVIHIERLTQQDPHKPEWQRSLALVLNSYAWILLTAEPTELRDPAEALKLAKQAAQLSPQMTPTEQAMILNTLAVAHHMTGEQRRAIEVAEQALLLIPASATGAEELRVRQELETHLADFRAAQQNNQKRVGSR
jgi:tetratricopeptide (TPR) repeat protein